MARAQLDLLLQPEIAEHADDEWDSSKQVVSPHRWTPLTQLLLLSSKSERFTSCVLVHGMGGTGKVSCELWWRNSNFVYLRNRAINRR